METTESSLTETSGRDLSIVFRIAGVILLLGGFTAFIAYMIVPFVVPSKGEGIEANSLISIAMGMGLVYGGLMIWSGWRGARMDHPLRLPTWLWLVFPVAFVLVLALGQAALLFKVGAAWTFPPFHILASLSMSLMTLSYAAPRLGNPPTRSLALGFTWGGLGTVAIALVLEVTFGAIFAVIGIVGAFALLGVERLQRFARLIQNDPRNIDPAVVYDLLSENWLFLIWAGLIAILFLSFLVPLIEESAKILLPALRIRRRDLTARRALWWALCAGAGYAFSENLLNGMNAAEIWIFGMALRGGTSFMHIGTTGTLGVAFYLWLVEGKFGRWMQLTVLALGAHGFWNLIAILLSFVAVTVWVNRSNPFQTGLGIVVLIILVLVLLLLISASALWVLYLVRWARSKDAARDRHIHPPVSMTNG